MINAELVTTAFSRRDFPPDGAPEIALAGRSNVGKSSLINRLAGVKNLARTSSTPGKTQSINFYSIERTFFLVDLPGFGYAKRGKTASREWNLLTEEYFSDRSTIVLVLQLVDARMPPTRLDLELADWLNHLGIPYVVIATKADKLSGNGRALQKRIMAEAFGAIGVILASAVTGAGCGEIWKRVTEAARKGSMLGLHRK